MRTIIISAMLAAAAALVPAASADVLADWTFENVTITGSGTDYGPVPHDPGVPQVYGGEARGHHAQPATAWSSPVGNGSAKSFSSTYWSSGDYYQFRTNSAGYQNVTITWHQTRSSTGPGNFALLWSIDGSSWAPLDPNYAVAVRTWSSSPPPDPNSIYGPKTAPPSMDDQPTIYFRLVSLVTPASTGTCRVDNIVISGTLIQRGACCNGGVCTPNLTLAQCTAQGGVWKGAGTDCFPNPCVPINYYWDATTGEQGGDGYTGQWIYYPNAPGGAWYNMWWPNEFALDRQKDVMLTFTTTFPFGSGNLEVAMVRATPDWTLASRPPLANEEQYIVRDFLGTITTPGTYTFPARMPYCPSWVSIDVRGNYYAVQGTIGHTCLAAPTGACCVGSVCTPNLTALQCTSQGGIWKGAGTDCFPNPCVPINYYWDATTGEQGGDGYTGQWIYYPNAPDGPWYNMWWFNGLALDRQKDATLTFTAEFPVGTGLLDVAMVRTTPSWTLTSRPPLADEEEYIEREFLGTIMTAGTYTFTRRMPFCPTWVSIDVRGSGYAVQGTIAHTCLALQTGACCVGWDCSVQTRAACAAMSGRYQGDGTTCGPPNPCVIIDTVVCEPQPPNHPNTYWYDVTPGAFGRCDFHVRVYDPVAANYTGWQMTPPPPAPTWQHLVHQVGNEWWVSWYDPNCANAIFAKTRFQFTNPNAAVWGDWRTTIGMQADPYDVWNIDNSGHHTTEADGYGYRVHVPTFAAAWYWKDCNGDLADGFMPDFDQRQDFNGDGAVEAGYCGPTAVANSIWWFNCKFPGQGVVPPGWTALDLVQDLAQRMGTNGNGQGTWLNNMQAGIDAYLQAQGVNNLLYEHTELTPTFEYIAAEVQRSQDVTLLVGFWHIEQVLPLGGDPPHAWLVTWKRVGGHYLTVAGVDPLNNRVALSDPDGDFAEHGYSGVVRPAGTDHNHDGDNDPATTISFRDPNYNHAVHNTDTYASHDYYTLKPSFSPGGKLALVLDGDALAYGQEMWSYHQAENGGEFTPDPNIVDQSFLQQQGYPDPVVCQYYAEIEAAVVVSPFEACGPQVGGLGCKPVVCPDPTQQCLPKKVRHHIPQVVFPPGGTDHLLGTSGHMNLMDPNGNVVTYTIRESPPNSTTVIRESPVDMGGYRQIATEITEMELVADGGGGGGGAHVQIRESPTRASAGHTTGVVSTSTDYPADSFFDLFVEIDIPDLGVYGLYNNGPIPLETHGIMAIPPLGAMYNTASVWDGEELYTPGGYPTGYRIVGVTHILPQPPPVWEVIECACIDPNYCHIELGDGTYCVGDCPPGFDCTRLGVTNPDGSEDLWCDCLPSLGACCVGVICYPNMTEAACVAQGGTWKGANSDCFPNPCRRIDYYWDFTTGELGGNGYNGEWIYYPYAPDGPWYNMWWPNEFALNREKEITFTFTTDFPVGSGYLDAALVWATQYWTLVGRPPLADEEQYIQRQFLATITLPGTYTYVRRLPFCPSWISIDVRGTDYIIEGTVDHICLPAVTGACCLPNGTCLVMTEAACDAAAGRWYGAGVACRPGGKCPQWCKGDMNCDGRVTFADIDPFVAALSGESAWTRWPCPWINADCNSSGTVTFADIDPFVAVIGTTCLPWP